MKLGKLVAIGSALSMATPSPLASPATAMLIAMRWSRCVVTGPPPGSGVPPGPALVVEMLVVDGSDLGTLPPRRAMRILAKRLAEKALDALLDASPVDVIRLAAVVGAVTAAEAEKAATRAARDAASRARALADAAAREADERTRDFRRELAGYSR